MIGRYEVCYLGHVIGGGNIQPDPEKLRVVKDYSRLQKKKDVKAFLGLNIGNLSPTFLRLQHHCLT